MSVVPDLDRALVTLRLPASGAPAEPIGLFTAEVPADVFGAVPVVLPTGATEQLVTGLDQDDEHFFGVALDVSPTGSPTPDWRPVGPVLAVRTRTPWYVDPTAAPGGNGQTPATPFNDLNAGVLTAFVLGGGNVWVAEGTVADVALALPAGVDVYGGFPPSFDLASNDPTAHPTRLVGRAAEAIIALESSSTPAVLDGLELVGPAQDGIDCDTHPLELRRVSISGCGRGLKLRNPANVTIVSTIVTASNFDAMDADGISLEGAFDLRLDGINVNACGQEGLDADDLVAPGAATSRLVTRDSTFQGNAGAGIDVDLSAPPGTVPGAGGGGRLEVRMENCTVERNGGAGVFLDLDHEGLPAWHSSILAEGLISRRNGGAGVLLDVDASADVLFHRSRLSANGGAGLRVSSESAPGTVTLSTSVVTGNEGAGVLAELGSVGALLSHCVVAGNRGGGAVSAGPPVRATSSAAWQQSAAFAGATASVDVGVGPLPFVSAPERYARVASTSGTGEVALDSATGVGIGDLVEVADDGVLRTVTAIAGNALTLDPQPDEGAPSAATTLAFFAPGTLSAAEDWTPAAGSPLLGAALPSAAGGPIDAGPAGAPDAATAAEVAQVDAADDQPFRLFGSMPSWSTPIAASAELVLEFSSVPAAVAGGMTAADALGAPLAILPVVDGASLRVPAPAGGWPTGATVRVHAGLLAADGREVVAPVALSLDVL